MLVALVASLHHGICRLGLVMACGALCDAEIGMFLMRKSHSAQLAFKLYHRFIFRDRQARSHYIADKQ